MTTILDVARLADVSIATVSRVINGDPAVRPTTRRLVEEAIAQLDYRPNAAARSLRLARSHTLGLIVSDLANPIYMEVVHGIESVARAHGYSLFLCDGSNDPEVENIHLERLYERRVDGVILYPAGDLPPAVARFKESKSPVVAMGPAAVRCDLPGVIVNERPATVAAIQRLLALGHRRIGVINRDVPPGRFRFRTNPIRQELEAAGIAGQPTVVDATTEEHCRDLTRALLAGPDRPTALVVLTHLLTPHVLQAVYDAGLRIPDDVSVVAYGDSAWATAHRPPLAVVRIDYRAWGRETAEVLLRRIVAPDEKSPKTVRGAQFIERASIGPPPRSG
jgi:LacI family transcriptional regulator